MLDGLKRKIAGSVVNGLLASLANSPDTRSTVAGLVSAVVLNLHLDTAKLISGDPHQIATLVSGMCVAGIGFLATKENKDGHTTLLGVIAAAAQATVGDFTSALTIGLCGYFTNKPVIPVTPSTPTPLTPSPGDKANG
jgi:hypothetical protein